MKTRNIRIRDAESKLKNSAFGFYIMRIYADGQIFSSKDEFFIKCHSFVMSHR